ncbi:hypothetical protein [Mesobacterium pallidum]|uniref:hypothetical protein n=1 Tax=Mesobacterium pallidum TaxID=2872037 RepID=UPI001EE1552F|nr:hypothetical protein [Mesobacterium pallidum]
MTKKTLYLHIGYHKTGSTSVQTWMDQNRQQLAHAGLYYPETQRDETRNYHGKHLHLYSQISAAHKEGGDLRAALRSIFAPYVEEIEAAGCPAAILSEESFSGMGPKVIEAMDVLNDHFDVRVVAVLRRQDEFLQSFYHQSIKTGPQRDFAHFILGGHWNRIHYDAALDRWAAVFGREGMLVRSYDKDKRSGGLMQGFLDMVLGTPGLVTAEERQWNASTPSICYEIVRQCYRDGYSFDDAFALRKLIDTTVRSSPKLRNAEVFKRQYLTPNIRANVREMFAESNARTCETWFGGEDVFGDLSACTDKTAPLRKEPACFKPREVSGTLGRIMLRHAAKQAAKS